MSSAVLFCPGSSHPILSYPLLERPILCCSYPIPVLSCPVLFSPRHKVAARSRRKRLGVRSMKSGGAVQCVGVTTRKVSCTQPAETNAYRPAGAFRPYLARFSLRHTYAQERACARLSKRVQVSAFAFDQEHYLQRWARAFGYSLVRPWWCASSTDDGAVGGRCKAGGFDVRWAV